MQLSQLARFVIICSVASYFFLILSTCLVVCQLFSVNHIGAVHEDRPVTRCYNVNCDTLRLPATSDLQKKMADIVVEAGPRDSSVQG